MTEDRVTRWWWIRHAPVVDAHLKRLSGQADVAADVSDAAAFAALAPRLPTGAQWLVTPLQRTQQTAAALWAAGAERTEPAIEPAFAEQAFGDWTHATWAELADNEDAQPFWDAPATVRPPAVQTGDEAESFADVCARVAPRIDAVTNAHAGRDIVVVAHAGSIRAAIARALGLTPTQALGLEVKNLGLTRLDHIGGSNWRVVGLNQIW